MTRRSLLRPEFWSLPYRLPRSHLLIHGIRTAFRSLSRSFQLVASADRRSTITLFLLTLFSAALPAAQAFVGKLIVDTIVRATNDHITVQVGLRATLPFLLIEFALIALTTTLSQYRTLTEHVLHTRLQHTISTTIIQTALMLELPAFEDSTFYDKMQNAQRDAHLRGMTIINTSFMLIQNTLMLLSFIVVLFTFSPLVALALLGATLPSFLAQTNSSTRHFGLLAWHAPKARRMSYLEYLLTVDGSAKEVKLFGLGKSLLKRYDDLFWAFYHEDRALARRQSTISILSGLLSTLSYYGAYVYIVWHTLTHVITLGDMTLYLMLSRQSQATFQALLTNISEVYESALFLNNLFDFLDLRPQTPGDAHLRRLSQPLRIGIEFCNVSFRYPGGENWVLRGLNLRLAPGEKVALVGANGAGKTTLIKLLTRLYAPTEGHILLEGIDLREYDLDDLWSRIGVIFQDFVHYQSTLRENIGFGQIDALDDDLQLARAAQLSSADDIAEDLPHGYETMLGQWFERGHELSGGQWQKVALGRAFMRDAEVLVLDEPTAALDAEHEYEVFQRLHELIAGKMVLLISHRFSTVRMADRIAVLDGGRLTEIGTHAELMALGGTYARLFNLQAEGYR
ncbi:MAG: ABC transporter ATP-binding protein [Herpetosiphonaceae bacterium]|nr:ABC transporter ATP-binding protein [Herpetosiphonaceae bacterium]